MRLSFTADKLAETLVLIGIHWAAAALAEQTGNPQRFRWERLQQQLPTDAPPKDAAEGVFSLRGSEYV
jgi:hypothetical protein